jgi:hypothetical protein
MNGAVTPPPARLEPGRVVIEVPDLGHAQTPWRWFEIDLDHISGQALRTDPDADTLTGAHVIAMTRTTRAADLTRLLGRPRSRFITHLQYEVTSLRGGTAAAELIRDAGLEPLPATHLPEPPTNAGALHRALDLLTGLGTPLVKLAYPAPDADRVHWGVRLLTDASNRSAELALIPMGSKAGRAAALAAGSRLIWAPLRGETERWGAQELLPVLADNCSASEEGDRNGRTRQPRRARRRRRDHRCRHRPRTRRTRAHGNVRRAQRRHAGHRLQRRRRDARRSRRSHRRRDRPAR